MEAWSKCKNMVLNAIISVAIPIVIALWTGVFLKINEIQPEAYMDEIFHIPQAKVFCGVSEGGNFTWNPKITTLPGTYLMSIGILIPLSKLISIEICNVFYLRLISFSFNILNSFVIYNILIRSHRKVEIGNLKLATLTLTTLPVLFFTSFLYYTDSVSVFCVLLMYLLHLDRHNNMAALAGFVSVVMRQTNIIWVFLIGMEKSIEILEQQTGQQVGQTPKSLFKFVYSLLARFKKPYLFMCFFLNLIINLICSVFFYFITGILFLVFLYKNGGIVVGDKSAHEACINFPQLGYFLSFMLVSCLPQMISVDLIKQFFISIWNNVIITTLLTVAACLLIKEFTYVHPYTLADNRHLTFYVWKWIYERHDLVKYIVLPVYMYSAYVISHLVKTNKITWKLAFSFCLVISIVPQKLLEFRYFILPYLFLRFKMPFSCCWRISVEFVMSTFLNFVVIYVFLYKPFKWPNSEDLQRFMW